MTSPFKPTKGARLSQAQVDQYAPRILELHAEVPDKKLKPMDLVNDARSAESPLHDYFEWDDSEAAEKWRNSQAKYLLRSINMVVEYGDELLEIRLLHSVVVEEEYIYHDLNTIVTDEELSAQVVAQALKKLETWTERYRVYGGLESLASEISELLEEYGAVLSCAQHSTA